jgi:hypothetical protein
LTVAVAKASLESVDEIALNVERDGESGWLVASWDAPASASSSRSTRSRQVCVPGIGPSQSLVGG